jgi:hypothetical protein
MKVAFFMQSMGIFIHLRIVGSDDCLFDAAALLASIPQVASQHPASGCACDTSFVVLTMHFALQSFRSGCSAMTWQIG